jgi:hypothetical protein
VSLCGEHPYEPDRGSRPFSLLSAGAGRSRSKYDADELVQGRKTAALMPEEFRLSRPRRYPMMATATI